MEPTNGLPDLSGALGRMRGITSGFAEDLAEATAAMREMDGESRRLSRSLSSSLRRAFDKAVFGGAKLTDVFRDLASSVAGKALDAALRPVQNAIGSGLSGLVGGVTGALGSAFGFAKGGAFSSGKVRAFARGGVVDGPTVFPMRGATGLMGEAGPEAIMPLSRGPDGKLGVKASGGSAPAHITVNIQTPDIDGFRRAQSHVSASLARAVARGQRNL